MTHTLHPEILDEIVNSMNHYVDKHMYHALWMKKVLEKHLWPYLNMPQPIENEPKVCTACLWHKTHSKYTASKGTIEVNCSRCKGTWQEPLYDAKPKTYTLEQIEEEYDRWFTNWLLAMGGKKNDLKQSTPQIERIDWDTMPDKIPNLYTIINKLNEIIDYINNTLPTKL